VVGSIGGEATATARLWRGALHVATRLLMTLALILSVETKVARIVSGRR
jgi:hypothetical protein